MTASGLKFQGFKSRVLRFGRFCYYSNFGLISGIDRNGCPHLLPNIMFSSLPKAEHLSGYLSKFATQSFCIALSWYDTYIRDTIWQLPQLPQYRDLHLYSGSVATYLYYEASVSYRWTLPWKNFPRSSTPASCIVWKGELWIHVMQRRINQTLFDDMVEQSSKSNKLVCIFSCPYCKHALYQYT